MSTVMIWLTNSTASSETEKLGELLGKLLRPPAILELRSDLGGGKTTFARGLVRGLGSEDVITSPSFTLNQIYTGKNGTKISHYDFYRLTDAGIMTDELAESLSDSKTITIIEWGGIVKNVLPAERLSVELKPVEKNSDERQIVFSYPENMDHTMEKLKTSWAKLRP